MKLIILRHEERPNNSLFFTPLTENGKKSLDKSIKKISERIMVLFKKTDSKYMSGFINVIENL